MANNISHPCQNNVLFVLLIDNKEFNIQCVKCSCNEIVVVSLMLSHTKKKTKKISTFIFSAHHPVFWN
jgi:hypothetical protein